MSGIYLSFLNGRLRPRVCNPRHFKPLPELLPDYPGISKDSIEDYKKAGDSSF